MTLTELIKASQIAVGVDDDGIAGLITWKAIAARLGVSTSTPAVTLPVNAGPADLSKVDERSERNIATLHPLVQPYARSLVQRAAERGITIKIISGTRNAGEQNTLYAKGRTAPGPKVTNARFGYSNHNFGIAFDVGLFSDDGKKYIPESPLYKVVGSIGVDLGLEWGGNWKSIVDEPHFQLRPKWAKGMSESQMLTELRNGRSIA